LHRDELPTPPQGGHLCNNLLLDADDGLRVVTTKHVGAQDF
jgi:hypothetical protein